MVGKAINIRSRDGGEFDYLVTPETDDPVPAIVLASAIHGVDVDIRAIANEFAAHGFLVAAPDLFWRSIPGPLSHDDGRAAQRSQPRLEKIKVGERDMADTLAYLGTLPKFNGRAAAMGFCYGGPYAILGPKRHGYMMRGSPKAFDPVTRDFSMARALAILDGLRGGRASQSLRHGS